MATVAPSGRTAAEVLVETLALDPQRVIDALTDAGFVILRPTHGLAPVETRTVYVGIDPATDRRRYGQPSIEAAQALPCLVVIEQTTTVTERIVWPEAPTP